MEIFNMVKQTKYVQARVQPDLYKKLQFYCVEKETSIQEVIVTLIRDLLEKEKQEKEISES
jgi:hypothetical protein